MEIREYDGCTHQTGQQAAHTSIGIGKLCAVCVDGKCSCMALGNVFKYLEMFICRLHVCHVKCHASLFFFYLFGGGEHFPAHDIKFDDLTCTRAVVGKFV